MNILFTICGRAGSKGVKNKNIRDFLGFPCAAYTLAAIELFQESSRGDDCSVVLNTDSPELQDIIRNRCGLPAVFIERREELCGDAVPKIRVIGDCLEQAKKQEGKTYDVVLDLDITSPLRRLRDIAALLSAYRKGEFDVVFSVTESRRNPYFNMVTEENGYYRRVISSDYTARQQAPSVYDMNASLYAYRPAFLYENRGIFEGRCGAVTMLDTAVLDIDSENDFELMQIIGEYLFRTDQEFGEIMERVRRMG